MSKREIKRFSSVLYFIVSCSILFVNRKHIVRRISLMMEDGMFNRISRGQAAENRNARLKDEMERGENMAGLIALIAIIFLLSISSICSMIDGTVL